jgi:Tfp pilus assembly protein PilN
MIKINLLRPQKKEIIRPGEEIPEIVKPEVKKEAKNYFTYLIVIVIIIIGSLFYFQHQAIKKEKKLLAKAKEEREKLAHIVKDLEELQNKKLLVEKRIELINNLRSKQEAPVVLMDELSKNLPNWVWLTSLKFESNKIEIKGRALSNSLIADYITNLNRSAYFTNVNLIDSTQKKVKGEPILEFTLTSEFTYQSYLEEKTEQGKIK